MWKKWLAFASMLVLVILLDPTHTPAQPGFGKGNKGDRKSDQGGNGPRRDGGTGAVPGTPGTFVIPGGGTGTYTLNPTGGAPGWGQPPSGDRPAWGQPTGGMTPGGGQGGPRRGMDPEWGWRMLQGLTGESGDTVDLSKIPPERRATLDSMAQRFGTTPLPTSGVWTKATYAEFQAKNDAIRAANAGGSGNPMGGMGGPTMDPNGMGMGRGRGMGMGMDPSMWGQGGWDQGAWGGNWGQRPGFEKKETEEERPVAMRYGKLPQGLPTWYDELDTDKDGQVSLFEWRKGGKDTKEFTEMDLNGDGLVTADEYLRFARQRNIDTKVAAYEEGTRGPGNWGLGEKLNTGSDTKTNTKGPWPNMPGFGPGGPKGPDSKGGETPKAPWDKSGDKGGNSDKKGNPWMKKN